VVRSQIEAYRLARRRSRKGGNKQSERSCEREPNNPIHVSPSFTFF
jgi:hypothetical protein